MQEAGAPITICKSGTYLEERGSRAILILGYDSWQTCYSK